MTEMTPKERELCDARAEQEAWDFAGEILRPWVQAARAIGHPELTQVMEKALTEVEGEVNRAHEQVEALVERGAE